MAAAGVDVGYVATHLGMPEANIESAISDPTADLVVAILAAVEAKAHEFDTLFTQKLQLEVELETSVRSAEAQRDASNETAKKALKDVEEIRQKLTQEETRRQALENELQSLKSSSSTSQSDIDTLRARIASLETSNRESLAIIDTKNATNETLSKELQAQHQKTLELSREVTALQQAIREQGLQRQLEAARRDIEWTDQELKKGARIAELQRQNDDAVSTLRQRLQDAQRKADDALAKIQQLEEAAARREEDFQQQQQNATQKNRLRALEEREAQVKRDLNMDKEELTQANESLQAETPRPLNGSAHRPSSPFATPAFMRKSITTTQALDEYYKVKGQLNDVLEQLQAKAPELEELYAENERLQAEIQNMSHLSDETRKAESAASQAQAEISILRNQLRDLGAQIQMLLFNMHCREKGLDELSIEETMILQRLVVFKDIQELQEKNEKLLQSEEAIAAKNQAVEDHRERIRLQQELDIKTESITKERDMFRRIVESRASADEIASALGHPPQDGVLASIEHNAMNADGDYATLLEDIRKEFDDYRKEQTTDRKTLKEQIEKLITSQLSLASERFDMLKSNYAALENENKELQRRNNALSESAAKQDIRTQNVAEELVEARAMAEKNLWQDIQDRLSRDNENLVQEKSRLNKHADAETKRRLQATINTLEAELTSTKRKLAEEVEEAKKAQLRKEFDAQQSQKRIDELTANLGQIREELVAVKTSRDHLQKERAERLQPRPTPRPGSMQDGDERIQELIHEATDLKRDLEMTKYKELSQASEEELERLNAAQDQYVQEMDKQRLEDLSSELSRSNGELSALRDSQADVTRQEVKRLKDEEEHYRSSSQFHQQDLRAQAEIAASAQQAYENEVMKHGETAKALSNVRNEYNQLKTSATLMQSESSWDEQIRSRWEDANAQNKLLHQQLENVTAQISALQDNRASSNDSDADKYRELSNYLRREKDILEVQFELKLELKLEQERSSHGENDRNTMAHKDLMSKLEELNLFRESSAALRTEARQAQAQLTEKIARITELESTIQPLEAQIEELQSQQSFKEAEMKQLQEDRDRWQKRTEDILSKHGRTDPAEVEELKQKVAGLESERDALQAAESPLRERIQELEQSIAAKEAEWGVTRERLIASAKERSRQLTTANKQVVAEKDQIQKQFEEAASELASTKEELETFKQAKSELEEQVLEFKRQIESLQAAPQQNATPVIPSESPESQAALSELQTQLNATRSELETVSSQKASIEQELQNTRDQLSSVMAEKQQGVAEAHTQTNGDSGMENDVEAGQNGSAENTSAAQLLSVDERKALEDRIAASEARAAEWEAKAKELEQNHDNIVKHRSDRMKESLNKRLTDFRAQMDSERAQFQQDKERLEADFKLRMAQERKIWETEQASGQNETKIPSTPQQLKQEAPASTPSASIPELNNLGDQEIRELVSKNPTVRSIVQNNIKSKLAAETKRMKEEHETAMKAEWEQKIAQAKDSATQLVTSKMNLKLNMTENRFRMANAKLEVVEKAANETPQRPVGEVWEIAKVAKPPPVPKQPAPSATPTASTATTAPTNQSTPSKPAPASQEAKPTPSANIPPKPPAPNLPQPAKPVNNPFAASQQDQAPPVNPFAQTSLPAPQQTASTGIPQPAPSTATSQIPKASNLPVPGGARKQGGPQIPRGGARGGGAQRGRGGHQGRQSLNPTADHFQPGTKRPRGDSEVGNGQKRPRGGGPGS
ncbi:hypothetical protein F5Y01DRAFT_301576 [Xylaria sp. FL0043]|nr:hypothetical protein F5Y01DRAFT_301576 [Xylaria sp. FL0043]